MPIKGWVSNAPLSWMVTIVLSVYMVVWNIAVYVALLWYATRMTFGW